MQLREGLDLVRSGRGRRWIRRTVRQRLYSRRESVCLRRDLTVPFAPPPAKVELVLRHLRPGDDLSFIADEPGLSPKAAQLRADQRWLLSSDLPPCWIGIDPDGNVCFMMWLLTAQDNELIHKLWGDWLPELASDEALVEGIYTAESHRGSGIMPVAATWIAEQASEFGVRWGLGFIGTGNSPSLRGGEKAGWLPYLKREERWLFFRRRVRFFPIAEPAEV